MDEEKYRGFRKKLKNEINVLNRLYYSLRSIDFVKAFETLPIPKQEKFEQYMSLGHYEQALNTVAQVDADDPYTWSVRKLRIFARKHKVPYYSIRPKAYLVKEVLQIMERNREKATPAVVQQNDTIPFPGHGDTASKCG
jgi:hypothetical protein